VVGGLIFAGMTHPYPFESLSQEMHVHTFPVLSGWRCSAINVSNATNVNAGNVQFGVVRGDHR
jgi:hypothetical protein